MLGPLQGLKRLPYPVRAAVVVVAVVVAAAVAARRESEEGSARVSIIAAKKRTRESRERRDDRRKLYSFWASCKSIGNWTEEVTVSSQLVMIHTYM